MPPFSGFSRTMQTMISNYVKDFLLIEPSILKFFQQNNLIRKIPIGQDRWRYFDEQAPGYSKASHTIADNVVISPDFLESDVHLIKFTGKIVISKEQLEKFRSGTFVSGDLMGRTIAGAVRMQRSQVDQFIAWGDAMKNPGTTLAAIRNQGVYTGILNGGTVLAAGDGNDNIMNANGDYVSTLANYYDALQAAGHQANEYVLISDPTTRKKAFQGAHYLSTTGSTEYARTLNDYPWMKQWIATANCVGSTSTDYRIAMMQPKQKDSKGKVVNTMELITSHWFDVTPINNGGLSEEGNYAAFLETWVAFVNFYTTSIQRSANLTL